MAGFADGRLVRVRLACKTEHVSIDWDGTYADLAREFAEAFVADTNAPRGLELLDEDEECRARAKRAFRLRDRTTGMFHENFDPSDVCRHDVVTVNYESFHLAMAALARRRDEIREEKRREREEKDGTKRRTLSDGTTVSATPSAVADAESDRKSPRSPRGDGASVKQFGIVARLSARLRQFSLRSMYARKDHRDGGGETAPRTPTERARRPPHSHSTTRAAVWDLMDNPGSSERAAAVAAFVLFLIVYSTVTFCVETVHGVYDDNLPYASFWYVSEAICIAFFTIEIALRVWACPDRKKFFQNVLNLVDVVAVVPFYVDLVVAASGGDEEVVGLSVVRVVRLVRVFRLLKLGGGALAMFGRTMVDSSKPLGTLFFLVALAIVVSSSILYFLERGRWNEDMLFWERPVAYWCDVHVSSTTAMSSASTYSAGATSDDCKFKTLGDTAFSAVFSCPYRYKKNPNCSGEYMQSPFDSIVVSFWWAWTTMTSVGYGDIYPLSIAGKCVGGLTMFCGVLVIALPITIIGANFTQAFNAKQNALRLKLRAERGAAYHGRKKKRAAWTQGVERASSGRESVDARSVRLSLESSKEGEAPTTTPPPTTTE